ncbi:MAG: phosphate acyltransferase PlsX [Pseudomonadales bacterium]|nr:phosphate acyltransferase PlsX [Pseudomonadales bacterium]MCB1686228.1 phosphate acyltransferase PlsX [Pseudomonadales bacterium]MCP5346253.1 phosphate acyltransferase PlsX [Pseudomonadales bacterium]
MGGESGIRVTVPASLRALKSHPDLQLTLVGDSRQIETELEACGEQLSARLTLLHTEAVVRDDDKPTRVLRDRTESSMYLAVKLVEQGAVEACVSAGNTGALLLSGRHLLKTIRGIEKPAILATIPGANRNCYLLDVGANVDCKAAQLVQFAVMGSVLAESLDGLRRARVALLNIGVEDYKGSEQVKTAAALLEEHAAINYVGYVEGSALFEGIADVVVCDGFVGNVTIKSSAGVVGVINQALSEIAAAGSDSQQGALAQARLVSELQRRVDPSQFNGASLLGLQGSIIKSHGNASAAGFQFAIERAIKEARHNVPGLIAEKVAELVEIKAKSG